MVEPDWRGEGRGEFGGKRTRDVIGWGVGSGADGNCSIWLNESVLKGKYMLCRWKNMRRIG